MIPSTVGFLDQDFEIETQPSLTYKMDLDGGSVMGLVDEQDAMNHTFDRQVKFKVGHARDSFINSTVQKVQ